MIRQTGTTTVPLTRELAEEFATMPPWKGERPVRDERVQMLVGKIERGLFYSPTWAVARFDKHTTRMNGQHSSLALLECRRFPAGLEATILEFAVDCEADLAELFDQFDNPQSARRMKVKYIDPADAAPGGVPKADDATRRNLSARLGSKLRALAGGTPVNTPQPPTGRPTAMVAPTPHRPKPQSQAPTQTQMQTQTPAATATTVTSAPAAAAASAPAAVDRPLNADTAWEKFQTLYTRPKAGHILRLRECRHCGRRIITRERV